MRRTYLPQVFQQLNEFRVARQLLEQHREHLTSLGKLICNHDLNQFVGIALLHKHFDLKPNERLVEEFTEDSFSIKPIAVENQEQLIPYLWKADHPAGSNSWQYYPLEFLKLSQSQEIIQQHSKTIIQHTKFLDDMAHQLFDLGLSQTFGITLLHRDCLALKPDEILVETTDEQNRILTCSPITKNKVPSEDLTQTLWSFTLYSSVNTLGQCIMHCNSHCNGHCVGH
jgi:hypothetical protein